MLRLCNGTIYSYRNYNNIFNIRCTQDLLSKFPFAYQGFDVYGKKYMFDLTKNNAGYKEIFKKDFVGNSLENINACLDTVKELYPTLDYFYTFDKDYEDNIALESKNETDLQAELNEVKASLESIGYDKITTTKVVENPDYDENCYVWDYQNDKKQLLMKNLESKELKGTHVQNQYDFTEEKSDEITYKGAVDPTEAKKVFSNYHCFIFRKIFSLSNGLEWFWRHCHCFFQRAELYISFALSL